jgi:hypothetical protein
MAAKFMQNYSEQNSWKANVWKTKKAVEGQ